jgi:hypothetical protein
MAKRWVSQIVGKSGYFHQISVTAQSISQFAGDLGNFQGVRQSGAREVSDSG